MANNPPAKKKPTRPPPRPAKPDRPTARRATLQRTLSPLDLVSLAIFGQVAALSSFTAAARALGLSKSVVSERVRDLEDALGVRLLQRSTRRLALTEEGRRCAERCAQLQSLAQETQEAVTESAAALRGPIRLTAPGWLARRELSPVLADFLAQHPQVSIELQIDDGLVDLLASSLDCAIRMTRRALPAQLVARRLGQDRVVTCAAPAYLAARGVPQSRDELRLHGCLRYGQLSARQEWGTDDLAPPSLLANEGEVLREAALRGLGLARLPQRMVAADLATGRLVRVLPGLGEAPLTIYAVYPHRQVSLRLRRLLDYLVERLGA